MGATLTLLVVWAIGAVPGAPVLHEVVPGFATTVEQCREAAADYMIRRLEIEAPACLMGLPGQICMPLVVSCDEPGEAT